MIEGLLRSFTVAPGPSQIPNPNTNPLPTGRLELVEQDGIDLGKVRRIIGHLTRANKEAGRRIAFSQATAAILYYIFGVIDLDRGDIPVIAKTRLYGRLLQSVSGK